MKHLLVLFFSILSFHISSQPLPFNRKANLDTLFVNLIVSQEVQKEEKALIENATKTVLNRYNYNRHKYKVVFNPTVRLDSPITRTMTINIDQIQYASKFDQSFAFGSSIIGILALPVTLIASDGAFFLVFWFSSLNKIKGTIEFSDDLKRYSYQSPKKVSFNSSGGWFRRFELNKIKTFTSYQQILEMRLNYIDRKLKKEEN